MGFQCCGRPNGNLIFASMIFSTVAFALSVRGTRWCDYIRRDTTLLGGSSSAGFITEEDFLKLLPRDWGLWAFKSIDNDNFDDDEDNECYVLTDVDDVNLGTKWHSAMAFSVCTSTIGGICMIIIWFTSCLGVSTNGWRIIGFFLLLTCLFEGLTLIVFASEICDDVYVSSNGLASVDPDCSLESGAKCGIAATTLWFVAALSCCKMPPPKGAESMAVQQTTTTTTTTLEDGTKVVETKTETVPVTAE